jgi:hypothetical protein
MIKIFPCLAITLLTISVGMAQRPTPSDFKKIPGDSAHAVSNKPKKTIHYLGVQANQLLNQIFNFNGSAPAVSNPFLITYAANSVRTGWGVNVGLGYNVNTSVDNSDPNTIRKTTINNFSLRLGIEKKAMLSRRWLVSYGFDMLVGNQSDDTNASSQFQFNNNSTDTRSTTTTFGLGPRFSLSYFISEKILIGTEVTYYYRTNKISQNITNNFTTDVISPSTGLDIQTLNTSSSSTTSHATDFTFTVPVAIFLLVKMR